MGSRWCDYSKEDIEGYYQEWLAYYDLGYWRRNYFVSHIRNLVEDVNVLVKCVKNIKFVYYSRSPNELADLIVKRHTFVVQIWYIIIVLPIVSKDKKKNDVYPYKFSRYVSCSPYDAFINNSNCYMSDKNIKFSRCPTNHGSATPHYEFVLAKTVVFSSS